MIRFIFFIFLLTSSKQEVFSQRENFTLYFSSIKERFFLLEPLQFNLNIEHTGLHPCELLPFQFKGNGLLYGQGYLEYKPVGTTTWMLYCELYSHHYEMAPSAPYIQSLHGQKYDSGIIKIPAALDNQQYIQDKGTLKIKKRGIYEFRAAYILHYGMVSKDTIYSNSLHISLDMYKNNCDRKAFNYIVKSPKPNFLSIRQILERHQFYTDSSLEPYAKVITQKYKKSSFAPWAYIFLAETTVLKSSYKTESIYQDSLENIRQFSKITNYLNLSKKYNDLMVARYATYAFEPIFYYFTEVLQITEEDLTKDPRSRDFFNH